MVFTGSSLGKEYVCNARAMTEAVLIPGSGRSPGGGNGNPLQYGLTNPWTRGGWWATVQRVTKSQT